MSGEHYFSQQPESEARQRPLSFDLDGTPVSVTTTSGTFSPEGLDRGTAVLLGQVPAPEGTTLVDLGCGWGPLALTMAHAQPESTVWATDVNARARSTCEANAQSLGLDNIRVISPEDYPDETPIDVLWSNPPIRIGKAALHELLTTWLDRLAPDGQAWLVVAKHLGAESLMKWLSTVDDSAFHAERVHRDKGFWVIRVTRAQS